MNTDGNTSQADHRKRFAFCTMLNACPSVPVQLYVCLPVRHTFCHGGFHTVTTTVAVTHLRLGALSFVPYPIKGEAVTVTYRDKRTLDSALIRHGSRRSSAVPYYKTHYHIDCSCGKPVNDGEQNEAHSHFSCSK